MYQTPNVIPQNTGSSGGDLYRRFSLASTDYNSSTGDVYQSPRSLSKSLICDKSTEVHQTSFLYVQDCANVKYLFNSYLSIIHNSCRYHLAKMQRYVHTQILLYTVMPIKNEKKKIHSFTEAYRAIHLQLLLNLYIVILCIV